MTIFRGKVRTPTGTKVAVSEAIQDLVGRLAERLHQEADDRVAEAVTKHKTEIQQLNETLAALKKEAESSRDQLERCELALANEKSQHTDTASSATT